MAASTLVDLVQVYSTTVGTGTLALGTAVQGYLSPSTIRPAMTSGATVSYAIFDGPNSEVGQGALTLVGGIWYLARTVTQSTNNGSPISCSGNNQIVAFTLRAEDLGGATVVPFQAGMSSGGNTAGASGLVNAQIAFVGLGIITLSQVIAGQNATLSISGGAAAATVTGNLSASGNTTAATSSTTGSLSSLVFSGAGGVSIGLNGGTYVVSGATTAAQTVQTAAASALGNTTAGTSSSSLTLNSFAVSATGGISAGFSNGTLVLSAVTTAAQTIQTVNVSALGNTTGLTSSTAALSLSSLVLSGAGGLSLGLSNGTLVFSGATAAAQTVQQASASALGNTTGATSSSLLTLSTLVLSGAAGVSVGFNAGTWVISGATGGGGGGVTGISATAVGQTTGATSSAAIAASAVSFSGAGGVSIGYAAGSQIIISGATTVAQSIQTAGYTAVGVTTGTTTSGTASASSLVMSGAGGVSVGLNGGSWVISGATTANQTVGASALGATTALTSSSALTLNSLALSGAGGLSVGLSNGTWVLSGATTVAQSIQTAGYTAIGNTTNSTSSATASASSIVMSGAGGVSVGLSGGSWIISGATTVAQSIQTQGASALGNTTGLTSSSALTLNTLALSGIGGASVGLSNGTWVLSSPVALTSLGLLASSNTTGATSSTTAPPSGITFAGAGGVSVGMSAGSVIISGAAGGGGGGSSAESWFVAGTDTTGSTTSATLAQSAIVVSGQNGIHVGYSGNSLVLANGLQNYWEVRAYSVIVTSRALTTGTVQQFVQGAMPFALSFNEARMFLNIGQTLGTSSTNAASVTTSGSLGMTLTLGIYQPVASNSNSFTLLTSSSVSYGLTQSLTQNLASQSNAVTYNFMSGTLTSSTSYSLSSSTATAPLNTSLFSGANEFQIPFGPMTLDQGNYMFGLRATSAAAAFGAMNWSFSEGIGTASYVNMGNPGAAGSTNILPGFGNLGSAAFISALDWRSLLFVNSPFYVALMSQ